MRRGERMRAALLKAPGHLSVEETAEPQVQGPRDVKVNVKATAVCETDVAIFRGKQRPKRYPVIQGHESTGVVVEVGPQVTKVRPGDRVILNPIIYCGSCKMCNGGKVNLCLRGGLMGRESDGTLCEFVVVPEERVFILPGSVSFADGTSLELLTTITYAQRKVPISPGSSVVVLGCGASGLLHLQVAKISGAYPVIGVSRSDWKLEMAKKLGADVALNGRTENVAEAVLQYTGGVGADVVIEAAGTEETARQALELVAPGGAVIQFGIPTGVDRYPIYQMYFKDLVVYGTRAMAPSDYDLCAGLVERGLVNVGAIITHTFPLEKATEALSGKYGAGEQVLRTVIENR